MLKLETNEVPAGLESYYEDTGTGVFKLKVDGAVPASVFEETKAKLGEFRNNNVELKKRIDSLAQFETMFKSGEFSSEKLQEKVEALALERAASMKQSFEQQVAELTTALQAEKSRLSQIVMSDAVKSAALKHGVSETAIEDVLSRAKSAFTVEEGQLRPLDANLDAKGNKHTLESWMAGLASSAPHLFAASRGAGATQPGRPVPVDRPTSAVDLISSGMAKRLRK